MHVGIVGQRNNARAVSLVSELAQRLEAAGVTVVVDEATWTVFDDEDEFDAGAMPAAAPVAELADCDLAVSVGGDGTFLYAARGAGTTPIMGVNLGEVGFLNAVQPEEAVETVLGEVERVQETGEPRIHQLPRVVAETEDWSLAPALNEVVVQGPQRGHGEGCTVEVRVDGSQYTRGHADGVLVATAAGSTAYNLSEGGPLVHPAVPGLVITEMAGEAEMPSLAVALDSEITVRVSDADSAVVVSDGRLSESVTPPAEIQLREADQPVNIAGPPLDFFTALGKLR